MSILEVLVPSFYTTIYVIGIALWAIIINDILQVEKAVRNTFLDTLGDTNEA